MTDRIKLLLADYALYGEGRTPCDKLPKSERDAFSRRHSHGPLIWEDGGHEWRVVYEVTRTGAFIYGWLSVTCDGRETGIESLERMVKA